MNLDSFAKSLKLKPHFENGLYRKIYFDKNRKIRHSLGAIYYYVRNNEKTRFHSIDSDEYWIYNAGSELDVWIIKDNKLKICKVSKTNPILLVKKGSIFASKHICKLEGTLVTCITVPEFSKEKFKYYNLKELIKKYPKLKKF